MRITEIKGTTIDLTDAIKKYVEDKLAAVAKLTTKFEPCDVSVDVGKTTEHHRKGDVFKAEFNLTIPGTLLRAEAEKDDLYAAIDEASSDLSRQIKKFKEKMRDADRVTDETDIGDISEEDM